MYKLIAGNTMSRRVYTEEDVRILATIRTTKEADDTITQILKYIPAEIVAAFLTIDGIFQSALKPPSLTIQWAIFFLLLICTPIYLWRVTNDENLNAAKGQMIVGTLAFFIWVFAIGGPFTSFEWYTVNVYWGSIGIALCTVVFPIILGKTTSGLRSKPVNNP
jgi:hypothetical protein